MNKRVIFAVAIGLIASTGFASYPEANIDYLGYSDTVKQEIDKEYGLTNFAKEDFIYDGESSELSEEDSVTEQLKELGVTRSKLASEPTNGESLIAKNKEFWDRLAAKEEKLYPKVSEENKAIIIDNMTKVLTANGYSVLELNLFPWSEMSVNKKGIRAHVKVSKAVKKGNSYKEIQGHLAKVRDLCLNAATIDGVCYLSEMTYFIVEDPATKDYYEYTIINKQ